MRTSSADRESQSISDLFHSFDFNGLQTVRAEIHIRISIYISSGIQIVYSLCTFYNCEAIAAMLAQFISRRQYQTADSGLGSGNNWPHSLSMITRRRRAIDAAFSSTGFVVVVFFFLVSFLDQAIAYRVGLRPGTGSRFLVLLLLLLFLLLDVSTVQQKLLLQEIVTEHKKIYIVFLMHCGLFVALGVFGFYRPQTPRWRLKEICKRVYNFFALPSSSSSAAFWVHSFICVAWNPKNMGSGLHNKAHTN